MRTAALRTSAPRAHAGEPRPAPRFGPARPAGIELTGIGLLALAAGFFAEFSADVIGQLFLTEVLLIPVALVALMAARGTQAFGRPMFWALLGSAVIMLCGYMLTDTIRGTAENQYLRGWGRIAMLISDMVCVMVLVASDRRNLWWLSLGMGVGGLFYLVFVEATPLSHWKIGYATPVTLLVLCAGYLLSKPLLVAGLLGVSAVGIVFDARAEPVITLVVAALLWANTGRPGFSAWGSTLRRVALPLSLGALAVAVGFALTQDEFGHRRDHSSLGRYLSFTLGLKAIAESPLIGYGSWSDNKEISREQEDIMLRELGNAAAAPIRGRGFSPHSQILQSWYEGGLLGAVFFLALGHALYRQLGFVLLRRAVDGLSGLLVYMSLTGAWHLFMSPFLGEHRLRIALTAGTLLILAGEFDRPRRVPRGAGQAGTPGRPVLRRPSPFIGGKS